MDMIMRFYGIKESKKIKDNTLYGRKHNCYESAWEVVGIYPKGYAYRYSLEIYGEVEPKSLSFKKDATYIRITRKEVITGEIVNTDFISAKKAHKLIYKQLHIDQCKEVDTVNDILKGSIVHPYSNKAADEYARRGLEPRNVLKQYERWKRRMLSNLENIEYSQ